VADDRTFAPSSSLLQPPGAPANAAGSQTNSQIEFE
jgi:hypothetical protein